jgi:hypothetical protein
VLSNVVDEHTDKKEVKDMWKYFTLFLPGAALLWVLAGCQALTGDTLGQNIDDTTITTTVKTKLAAEKGTTLTRIQVDTNRGVVQLSGTVESAAVRSRAEQVVREVSGVRSVVNNLQVQ